MIGRMLLSGVIGAILAFGWGFASWGMGDLWKFGFKGVPNEAPLLAALPISGVTEASAYYFPPMPRDMSDAAATSAWEARHRAGPIGILLVSPSGAEPMPPMVLIRGFAIQFVAATLLAFLVGAAGGGSGLGRLGALVLVVAFALVALHGTAWNFLLWPDAWGQVMAADGAVTWLLAGLPAVFLMGRAAPRS